MSKPMKIVVVGGNGQVASEVSLILAKAAGVDVRPISRTRQGSAFLRYAGLPVLHGSISEPEEARRMLAGADVVANFALALGTPAAALKDNAAVIEQTFAGAPKAAKIVFFSTVAIYEVDQPRKLVPIRGAYANLKLDNERVFREAARRHGREGYVLRLGHVAGPFQTITQLLREEVKSSVVRVPDPERASNVTHTATIAEALLAIGEGRAGPPGVYDLLDCPQWSWREVYEHEARQIGMPLRIEAMETAKIGGRAAMIGWARRFVASIVADPKLRHLFDRALALAPVAVNDYVKARYHADRTRREIAALSPAPPDPNAATLWPALEPKVLSGLRTTREIIDLEAFQPTTELGPRWPVDAA
jgi:nucleoside-diphosphate-sugar epimerase